MPLSPIPKLRLTRWIGLILCQISSRPTGNSVPIKSQWPSYLDVISFAPLPVAFLLLFISKHFQTSISVKNYFKHFVRWPQLTSTVRVKYPVGHIFRLIKQPFRLSLLHTMNLKIFCHGLIFCLLRTTVFARPAGEVRKVFVVTFTVLGAYPISSYMKRLSLGHRRLPFTFSQWWIIFVCSSFRVSVTGMILKERKQLWRNRSSR